MKITSDITAPLYLELICKKGIETDNLINEVTELASLMKVQDVFQLEGIVESIMDDDKSLIIISVAVVPVTPKGEDALAFVKAVFENFFNYYPKYTEPI